MSQTFRLYWLRESACDAGTIVEAAALDPSIRDRVLALTEDQDGEFLVRLPFLDRSEWRQRHAILSALPMERAGNLIRSVLNPAEATRDAAATLIFTDPAWQDSPEPTSAAFQSIWRSVSLDLQKDLRHRIPREFLEDPSRCQNRACGYALAVYQGSRPFLARGRERGEYAYDLRDYPNCPNILTAAWRLTRRPTEIALSQFEEALNEARMPELALRYSPFFAQDVQSAVHKRPKRFVELLALDSVVINAVVDLAADPTVATVTRTARVINSALRNVLGLDLRRLGVDVLEEATRALAKIKAECGEYRLYRWTLEDGDTIPSRRPHPRIAREKDGDHRRAHGRG